MNLQAIRDLFRGEIRDTKKPYRIGDKEADAFANDAESEAARRSRVLVDSTTEGLAACSVVAGDPLIPLDKRIISIRRIRLQSRTVPLQKRTVRQMDEDFPGWETSTSRSTPLVVVVDYDSAYLRLHPVPKDDDALLMTVTREPLTEMVKDTDEPELPRRYHASLVHWMKKRAYSRPNVDLFDAGLAKAAEAEFTAEFGPAPSALNERFEFEHYDDVGEL